MSNRPIQAGYWALVIIHLLGILFQHQWVLWVSKPLLMVFLGWFYFRATAPVRTRYQVLILLGFVFSFSGDVNLMLQSLNQELFFLFGLVSFLITHVFYIIAFMVQGKRSDKKSLLKQHPYLVLPVLAAYGALLWFLLPSLGDMTVPVIIYASVITLMVLAALYRGGKVSSRSFWLVLGGAMLFMFSDSVIALSKFTADRFPIDADTMATGSRFIIMLTYTTSQYLIAEGTKTNEP